MTISKNPVTPKPAATVLVGRNGQQGFEVLLLLRNKALAFAGGVWVFPGGKIEQSELEGAASEEEAAKIAAAREAKEETNLEVGKERMIFYRHWTTPAIEPRRYATWFFFAGIEDGTAIVTVDDSEIKEHLWIHPQTALDQFKNGQLALMPPTFISLQLIRHCQSVEEAEAKVRQETPVFVEPVLIVQNKVATILYKGDAGYTTANPDLPGPRHRLINDFANRKSRFEYEGCDEFPPVNGGDIYFS
ncbi:MAG: NUDIX hydrolase [Bacteroidota bacterium]